MKNSLFSLLMLVFVSLTSCTKGIITPTGAQQPLPVLATPTMQYAYINNLPSNHMHIAFVSPFVDPDQQTGFQVVAEGYCTDGSVITMLQKGIAAFPAGYCVTVVRDANPYKSEHVTNAQGVRILQKWYNWKIIGSPWKVL